MFSVMKMGTWRRPSCTAMVRPTISGMMVERRDHVRMTAFWPERSTCSAFFMSLGSTKGPFLVERDIGLLHLEASAYDVLVGVFATAGTVAEGGLSPGGLGPGQADGRPSFAAAVRMIARAHHGAPHLGATAHVAAAAGPAQLDLVVLYVAHLANGGHAIGVDAAHLP